MEYHHRFSKGQGDLGLYKNDPFEIKVKKDAQTPIVSCSYRYNPVVAKEVDSIIEKYLKAGILRRSQSPYAAPIVVVLKKNGGIRITCDYRRLNEATIIPQTSIPRIDELHDTLGSDSFFSSFDMMSGFHQIMIGENSVPLTAFCTTSGLYEILVMPMGTSGSPGHFQRVMKQVTADLAHFVKQCTPHSLLYDVRVVRISSDANGHIRLARTLSTSHAASHSRLGTICNHLHR